MLTEGFGNRAGSLLIILSYFICLMVRTGGQPLPPSPPPPGNFEAGVLLVTQTSIEKAPQKYPQILEQVLRTVRKVQDSPLPYTNSNNLYQCGNSTAPATKWQAYLNASNKVVTYINNSLTRSIRCKIAYRSMVMPSTAENNELK